MADGEGTYDNVVEGEQLGEHTDVVNAGSEGGADAEGWLGGAPAANSPHNSYQCCRCKHGRVRQTHLYQKGSFVW